MTELTCLSQPHQHIKADLQHGILTLAIDRPQSKNALYSELYLFLVQALQQADQSKQVQVVILRGADGDLTAGNDMQDFAKFIGQQHIPATEQPPFLLLKAAAQFSKPLIVAIKGVAIGIGVTLLLHADFAYADEKAVFQMPFSSLGLSPEGGASQLLQRRAGYLLANDLIMTARKFDSATALHAGLINQICDEPYEQAEKTARHLAKLPMVSLKTSKALMKHDMTEIVQLIDQEAEIFMQRVQSAEMREALTAFQEKRPADFSHFNQA
ncbi:MULTISPECIES: enoyl-CoA hydratase-related protein [unclassified Acinetobacter]|uniref:enoyl-CoA hydratase-related protein n=1 Tax=unclassified Acinetobacter TaxID=196816 RepID=UPI0035BB8B9C